MRFRLALFIFFTTNTVALCQSKIDTALQKKISAMFREDQKWRIESNKVNSGKTSIYDEDTIDKNMQQADSVNMITAKLIIKKYGFPGYNLVDTTGSTRFWAIVQHADDDVAFQQQVLLLMGKQVKRHNAPGEDYALLQDRVLVNTKRKQLYGTQVRINPQTHKATPLPIQDPLHVDARRKSVGLMPLRDYLKSFEQR